MLKELNSQSIHGPENTTGDLASETLIRSYYSPCGISYRVFTIASSLTDGYNIDSREFSKRETIILINGLSRSKDHWIGFDEELSPEFNVITFDPRGIGESRKAVDWQHGVNEISDDLHSITSMIGINKYHIMGFSLGGMVAIDYAMQNPESVKTITIVNSSIGGAIPKPRLTYKSVATLITSGFSAGSNLHSRLSDCLLSTVMPRRIRRMAVGTWLDLENRYGRGVLVSFKQLLAANKFRDPERLTKVTSSALVICGLADKFVPPEHSKVIYDHLPNCKYVEIQNGGHELHMDSRDQLKEALSKHVKTHSK